MPAIDSSASFTLAHIHTVNRIIDTFNTAVFHITILAFNPLWLTLRAEFHLLTPITITLKMIRDHQMGLIHSIHATSVKYSP